VSGECVPAAPVALTIAGTASEENGTVFLPTEAQHFLVGPPEPLLALGRRHEKYALRQGFSVILTSLA
jgi:hypothetical protein